MGKQSRMMLVQEWGSHPFRKCGCLTCNLAVACLDVDGVDKCRSYYDTIKLLVIAISLMI